MISQTIHRVKAFKLTLRESTANDKFYTRKILVTDKAMCLNQQCLAMTEIIPATSDQLGYYNCIKVQRSALSYN